MSKCPHCSETIDALAGFVTQATLEDRITSKETTHRTALDAQRTEIDLLKTSVSDLTGKAKNYDAVSDERDTLKTEIVQVRQVAERHGALSSIGVTDSQTVAGFEAIFASVVAGMPEGDRPKFAEFDKWAKEHPLLSPNFKADADDAAKVAADAEAAKVAGAENAAAATDDAAKAAAAKAESGLPGANAGAAAPDTSQQGKMTPQQVGAYFRSPEYLAMDKDAKAAKMTQLKADAAAPTPTP